MGPYIAFSPIQADEKFLAILVSNRKTSKQQAALFIVPDDQV